MGKTGIKQPIGAGADKQVSDEAQAFAEKLKVETGFDVIHIVELVTPRGRKVAYLREPTREEKFRALSMLGKEEVGECTEMLLNVCWLDGNREILEDDNLLISCIRQVTSIVNIAIIESYYKKK